MKKTLALILALLMVLPMLVVPTAAEQTTASNEELQFIPVSDGTSGWIGNKMAMTEDGTVTVEIDGIPTNQSAGQVLEMCYNASKPLDISGMTMLEFDLYLENAAGVVNGGYQVELRSVHNAHDDCEISLDGGVAYMKNFVSYELTDGWNHVEIPLSRFTRSSSTHPYDPTQWCYFRIYNQPGGDSKGNVTTHEWTLGTEGKQTVVKIDNMFFSNKTAPTEEGNGSFIITKSGGRSSTTPGKPTDHGNRIQWATKKTETDITDYTMFNMDVYLSDLDAKKLRFDLEMTSSGGSDVEEGGFGNRSLQEMAEYAGVTLARGWNRISFPLAIVANAVFDQTAFDYFRIFDRGTTGSEYAVTTTDPETGEEIIDYGHARNVVFSSAWLSGSRANDDSVKLFSGSAKIGGTLSGVCDDRFNENGELCVNYTDGAWRPIEGVESDGMREWLWIDKGFKANYNIGKGEAIASFQLSNAMPHWEDFGGIQFEICMSDAKFGLETLNWEYTSAGTSDNEELEMGRSLNNITGQTLEANKWYTVTLNINYFRTTYPTFSAVDFDFFRVHLTGTQTYENGLCVAVRNVRAIRKLVEPTVDADGNPVLNMEHETTAGGNRPNFRNEKDNAFNIVGNVLNYSAGETINASGAQQVNDSVIKMPVDASHADWIRLDLYLENLEEWGSQVKILFGISSSGTCDKQQMTRANKNIYGLFGNYVVNEDGSKGELKDGWNRIEFPMYEMFDSMTNADIKVTDTSNIDWNLSGPIQMDQIDFYRTYIQGTLNGQPLVLTKDSKAFIDNMTFFDGGIVGTRDDIVVFGDNTHNTYLTAISTGETSLGAKGYRKVISGNFPMDITDKAYLQMDIFINDVAKSYTSGDLEKNLGTAAATFQFELSSHSLKVDTDEKQFAVYWANLVKNVEPNTWTTVKIPLPADFPNTVNKKAITRVEFFNDVSIPAGFLWRIDNVCFVRADSLDTKLVSAQPTLTENINLTVKGNINTTQVRTAFFELALSGSAGTTRLYDTATLTPVSDGKSASATLTFDGIPAHRMTDTFTMTMWSLGCDYSLTKETKTYSIQEYATNMLAKSTDAKLTTLLSDMLVYGAAAQTYANYNMDSLANAVEGLKPTEGFNVPGTIVDVVLGSPAENGPKFRSVTLVLDGTVHIRYTFSAASVEGLTLTVGDKTYTDFASADGYYYVDVPVAANQFDTVYNAHFGEDTAYSVNYSVNHYIATKHPAAGAKLGALLEALYNYGASAAAYQ